MDGIHGCCEVSGTGDAGRFMAGLHAVAGVTSPSAQKYPSGEGRGGRGSGGLGGVLGGPVPIPGQQFVQA